MISISLNLFVRLLHFLLPNHSLTPLATLTAMRYTYRKFLFPLDGALMIYYLCLHHHICILKWIILTSILIKVLFFQILRCPRQHSINCIYLILRGAAVTRKLSAFQIADRDLLFQYLIILKGIGLRITIVIL